MRRSIKIIIILRRRQGNPYKFIAPRRQPEWAKDPPKYFLNWHRQPCITVSMYKSKAESPLSWCPHEIVRFMCSNVLRIDTISVSNFCIHPFVYWYQHAFAHLYSFIIHFWTFCYMENWNQEKDLYFFQVWIIFRGFNIWSKTTSRNWCKGFKIMTQILIMMGQKSKFKFGGTHKMMI